MRKEAMAIILTSDLAAKARGRAFPLEDFQKYLVTGCGWVPANLAIDPFGRIITPNPFGSLGDLRMIPDVSSISRLSLNKNSEQVTMILADTYTPEGIPWENDPRSFLKNAISDLENETGLSVIASFEHEFMMLDDNNSLITKPFSLESFLAEEEFGGLLLSALNEAGLEPEMWLPEFGKSQFEVTMRPAPALVAADRAIYLREITRHIARLAEKKITFSPVVGKNGGTNGVHIHLSLRDNHNRFVTYDPDMPGNISSVAGSFAAGILSYSPYFQAIATGSPLSYERLVPNHWSASGYFLGRNNREASLRICPLFNMHGMNHQKQFNLEYRVTDVTSNPWLILGCILRAGLEGIRNNLPTPYIVDGDPGKLSGREVEEIGIVKIPSSLTEALSLLDSSETVLSWFSSDFIETLRAVKYSENQYVRELGSNVKYNIYSEIY